MTQAADPRRWGASRHSPSLRSPSVSITILSVALPTIAADLSAGTAALQWIVNPYILVLAGLMLICGALGGRYGRKRLPIIGLVIGALAGERLAAATRYRIPVAAGLLILAAGPAVGASTGFGFVAVWMAAVGLGIGLALSPAMDAVLGALLPERAGAGTAITMTLRQVGGALGVAMVGSLLAQG